MSRSVWQLTPIAGFLIITIIKNGFSKVLIRQAGDFVPIFFGFWFVYICKARTGRYYVGITNNPALRLEKHNSGTGAQFARDQGPFKLLYVSNPLPDKSMAREREAQINFPRPDGRGISVEIKRWSRIKKEKLINGSWQ